MKRWKIFDFPCFEDARGSLTPYEFDENFPFPVKRTYVVTGKTGVIRGAHAHLIESEMFVCVAGSVTATVNDGSGNETVRLDRKTKGLFVASHCWHEFSEFSADAILLCFSSTHYLPGETNYVTDKKEFLEKFSAEN